MTAADLLSPTIDATSPGGRSGSSALARSAGWTAAGMLTAMAAVHAYWAVGGGWPTDPAYSPLVPHAVVGVLLLGSAVVLLARAGVLAIQMPGPLLRAGPGVLAGVFAMIGLSNVLLPAGTRTADWQVYVFGAAVLVLAALCAVVAGAELPGYTRSPGAIAPAMWIGLFDVRPKPGAQVLEGAIGAVVYAAAPAPDSVTFEQDVRLAAGELGLVVTQMEDAEPASASALRALRGGPGRLIAGEHTGAVAWGTFHAYDNESE
jgi:hypothetical protein